MLLALLEAHLLQYHGALLLLVLQLDRGLDGSQICIAKHRHVLHLGANLLRLGQDLAPLLVQLALRPLLLLLSYEVVHVAVAEGGSRVLQILLTCLARGRLLRIAIVLPGREDI